MKVNELFNLTEYYYAEDGEWYSIYHPKTRNYRYVKYNPSREEVELESASRGNIQSNTSFSQQYDEDIKISYQELPQAVKDFFDES